MAFCHFAISCLKKKTKNVDVYFTAYNCRYVTCDYYQWSSWSASCGVAIKRTRGLSKVNEHFIKQQGGCSGLKVTCDKQETEIKTTNCEFILQFFSSYMNR